LSGPRRKVRIKKYGRRNTCAEAAFFTSSFLLFTSYLNQVTSEALIFGYVVSLLAGISILAIYSELRGRRFQPAREQDRIFRCEGCAAVYTDDADVERSRCTQCGKMNGAIEF
jgi:hypothetical protein